MSVVMLITTRVDIATINHPIECKIDYMLLGANMQELYEVRVEQFNEKAHQKPKTNLDMKMIAYTCLSFVVLLLLLSLFD